jgi:hypothetical protein
MDVTPEPVTFQFIHGIGPHGLSPFEVELGEPAAGVEVFLAGDPAGIAEMFGHIAIPIPPLPEKVETLCLRVKVLRVERAEPRAVIKAMAELAACGDHCCGH